MFGLGTVAPFHGLFGVVLGTFWYLTVSRYSARILWLIAVIQTIIAVIVSGYAETATGVKDSTSIVIDEFVAIPFIFLLLNMRQESISRRMIFVIFGVTVFSILDSTKILGIRFVESFSGGIGIVGDDLAASFFAAFFLWIFSYILRKIYRDKQDK